MKKNHTIQVALFALLCLASSHLYGQLPENSELYKTIISQDSLLFNVGFNTCDIRQFENILSASLEFYHDKDGLSTKAEFLHNLKNGLCIAPEKYQSRRELIAAKTAIYPLYRNDTIYGAVQNGAHQFYESIEGKEEKLVGSAQFTSVWILDDAQWKLTRILSYDHQAIGEDYED